MPFYDGSSDQLPPDGVETENIAYRGTAVHHAPKLELAPFGNSIPNLTYDISNSGAERNTVERVVEFTTDVQLGFQWKFEPPLTGQTSEFIIHAFIEGINEFSSHRQYEFTLLDGAVTDPIYTEEDKTQVETEDTAVINLSYWHVEGTTRYYATAVKSFNPTITYTSFFTAQIGGPLRAPVNQHATDYIVYDGFGANQLSPEIGSPHLGFGSDIPVPCWAENSTGLLTYSTGSVLVKGFDPGSDVGRFRRDTFTNKLYYYDEGVGTLYSIRLQPDAPAPQPIGIDTQWTLPVSTGVASNWDYDVRNDTVIVNGGLNQSIGYENNLRIFKITHNEFDLDEVSVLVPGTVTELYDHLDDDPGGQEFPTSGARWISDRLFVTEHGVYRWGFADPGVIYLDEVLDDQMDRVGITSLQRDNTAFATTLVPGYTVSALASARANCAPLQQRWQFGFVESGYQLKSVDRTTATSVATIPEADLRAHMSARPSQVDPVVITEKDETELPRKVIINYVKEAAVIDAELQAAIDAAAANGVNLELVDKFDQGSEFFERLSTRSTRIQEINLPIAMDGDTAAQLAENLLTEAWVRRYSYEWTLSRRYSYLEPMDVVTLPVDNGTVDVMIESVEESPDGLLLFRGDQHSITAFQSSATGSSEELPLQSINPPGQVIPIFFDAPQLNRSDTDYRIFIANGHGSDGWNGAVYYRSEIDPATQDDPEDTSSFVALSTKSRRTVTGRVLGKPLASLYPASIDEVNTMSIKLLNNAHSLETLSHDDFMASKFANLAMYGRDERVELLRFRDATQETDGTWTISGLIRGEFGTEHEQDLHEESDYFVMVDLNLLDSVTYNLADVGDTNWYRALSIYLDESELYKAFDSEVTYTAENYKPWSPAQLGFENDGSDNITISWVRRARIDNELQDGGDIPLEADCTPETYDLEVYNSAGNLVRTENLTTNSFEYTTAMQATDGVGGNPTFSVKVYQISTIIGRGNAAEGSYDG